jgi:serine/threonine-protein kinase RsbW
MAGHIRRAPSPGPPPRVRFDEAVLLVSELTTNALEHTATGDAGSFQVTVYQGEVALLIAVKDDGSDKIPFPSPADTLAEDGRGLGLVELIASRWGLCSDQHGRTIWFELRWNGLNRSDPRHGCMGGVVDGWASRTIAHFRGS